MTAEADSATASTVVLIGAHGWIGQRVLEHLVRRGHRVVAASRRRPKQVSANVAWFSLDHRTDVAQLTSILEGSDAAINTAGAAHLPRDSARGDALFANEELPAMIGAATARAEVSRLVHLSSIKALAEGGPAPLRASDTPAPTTAYGLSKLAGEHAIERATEGTGVTFTLVRPPLVYGPNAPANFSRLVRLASSRRPVPLPVPYARRSVVFIENLASLLVHVAVAPTAATVIHASDTPHLTTRELVRRLSRAAGAADRVLPLPLPFTAHVARLIGRNDDLMPLVNDLIVEPSAGEDVAGWIPPFPEHRGLDVTLSA